MKLTDDMPLTMREAIMRAEIERLREALVIIANPLADFKRQAEKDGDHLSPLAISIANDPEYLKEVARTALKEALE